eukprot:TRINITY_DN19614_c0_g1_i1.p1 TRINITY_DN19614_c0_g1~~TRINITY_DN19614_c0_g1_i1.p1  ORF type:complete len:199 (-),score=52.61 TRINITY_DN19614_c0_g1_i1:2-598(-)
MYYLNLQWFGIAEDMIKIEAVGAWNALGFTVGQVCVHWLIASLLDLRLRSWELARAEAAAAGGDAEGVSDEASDKDVLNFGELHAMLKLVNTYSIAAVWLGFTSSIACSEGCNDANEWFWYWILVVLGNAAMYAAVNYAACKYEASAQAPVKQEIVVEGEKGKATVAELEPGEMEIESNPIQDSKQDSEGTVASVVVL